LVGVAIVQEWPGLLCYLMVAKELIFQNEFKIIVRISVNTTAVLLAFRLIYTKISKSLIQGSLIEGESSV